MISEMLSCALCPRECGVNRTINQKGFCKMGDKITVARASLHHWEEPCISGKNGSGTVFFSGCSLRCVYCQNYEISRGEKGKEIDADRLCEIFFELKEKGAHNINLVTPTHFLPQILSAIKKSKKQNINIPFVYNTSGYEKADVLKSAEGLVDIYLTDFKYMSPDLSEKYSFAPDYAKAAKTALEEMVRQQPDCLFNHCGLMQKGVIVRHLMLPGGFSDSKKVLKYLSKFKEQIYISIMSQFTPTPMLANFPEINRKVTLYEYEKLVDYALSLGITRAYIQEGESASESFIPDFDLSGV